MSLLTILITLIVAGVLLWLLKVFNVLAFISNVRM